ncbi:hypothetical protein BC832DRAFT_206730 [Gaertneriomyces semiglobifer]|nr:hypothetical protein BC832DRAFT_206730 [Gaertneriomyces semiglobifer]
MTEMCENTSSASALYIYNTPRLQFTRMFGSGDIHAATDDFPDGDKRITDPLPSVHLTVSGCNYCSRELTQPYTLRTRAPLAASFQECAIQSFVRYNSEHSGPQLFHLLPLLDSLCNQASQPVPATCRIQNRSRCLPHFPSPTGNSELTKVPKRLRIRSPRLSRHLSSVSSPSATTDLFTYHTQADDIVGAELAHVPSAMMWGSVSWFCQLGTWQFVFG